MMARNRGLSRYVQRGLSGRRGLGLGDGSGEVAVENAPSAASDWFTNANLTTPAGSSSSTGINWAQPLNTLLSGGLRLGQMALLPSGASLVGQNVVSPYGAAGGLLTSGTGGPLNMGTIFLYGAILIGGIAVISALGKK